MKTFLISLALAMVLWSNDARGQCGMISLMGEFNGWTGDEFLIRNPIVPDEFSLILVLTAEDDMTGDGIVEMKFRENADWTNNWGSLQFPGGTAILNGPSIPVPIGSYLLTFNCITLEYYFQSTCGLISVIGEFNGWAADVFMTRDPLNPDNWTTDVSFNEESNYYDPPDIIEVKFRQNADWDVNWGASTFPSGFGYQGGPNIPVPLTYTGLTTDYHVYFDCSTGYYSFTETSGPISLSGEFNGYNGDHFMTRNEYGLDFYTTILTLYPAQDFNNDGFIEMKFRENADWTFNWGSSEFPSGIAVAGGPYIQVPLDNTGLTTDYYVTFIYSSLEFNFQPISGNISIIGSFNGWAGDVPMNRFAPDEWTLTRCWISNSDIKFRENNDWAVNWGNTSWPSGTGYQGGPNIPLVAGTYNVYFNSATGEYQFWENPDACGEIGMVGDFNEWGGNGDYPTDVYLLRDPDIPSRFSLDYNFYDYTTLLFRLNADPTFTNAWGGASLCQTGIQSTSYPIPIPAGTYHITFDFNSGDYCFTPISSSMTTAPKVFAMNIDGMLDEPEWEIGQYILRLIEGTQGADPNTASFGVAYSDSYLYVGLVVSDNYLAINDIAEFFMDGDNSGGGYDDHDVHFSVDPGGNVVVITGPSGGIVIDAVAVMTGDGYTIEAAVPWEALDVIPVENNIAGFDIIVGDDDSGTGVEYRLSWSGTANNASNTSEFGEVTLGTLDCGCISLYNPDLGDIILRTPDYEPATYLATFDFENNYGVVFRHGKSNFVIFGSPDFPYGTAVLGGPEIPAVQGRYRISFNCLSGVYSFEPAPAGNNVALAEFTDAPPLIDGQLDEYDLVYDCNILAVGTGPVNNVVSWGARWDMESFYIGACVTDENLYGNGSPWDNDGIEFYIDGNNDKDSTYDLSFDTQVIMHILDQTTPWFKADGVLVTNYEYNWTTTDLGYNVEMRLGWDNFDFEPGRGRVIGWSLGNNDNDYNIGRDYQTVWYGNENNWSNTSVLGDLQLANGPYTQITEPAVQDKVLIYPNPTDGRFYVLLKGEEFGDNININVNDISGRPVAFEHHAIKGNNNLFSMNLVQASPGLYIIHIYSDKGDCFIKKLIIQ